MKLFKKRINRRRIKKILKKSKTELTEHLGTWEPKKRHKINKEKMKFVKKRYNLELRIEILEEILG